MGSITKIEFTDNRAFATTPDRGTSDNAVYIKLESYNMSAPLAYGSLDLAEIKEGPGV